MRLRADLRRFIDRLVLRVARRIARLLGRADLADPAGRIRARPVEQPAQRFTAVRPGACSQAAHAAEREEDDLFFVSPDPAPLPFGDFADRGEAERFAVLPPIGAGAADEVDWDALARAL